MRQYDWEGLAELDYLELNEISELVTSVAFYPGIFFGTLLSSIIFPIWALLLLFTGDYDGAWVLISVRLFNVWKAFLIESVRVPYSWLY